MENTRGSPVEDVQITKGIWREMGFDASILQPVTFILYQY